MELIYQNAGLKNHRHARHARQYVNRVCLATKIQRDKKPFNFKKTNGKKYVFSCFGYGGKCGNCGNQLPTSKKRRILLRLEVRQLAKTSTQEQD